MPINPVMPESAEIEAEQFVEGDHHDDSQPQEPPPPRDEPEPSRQEPPRRDEPRREPSPAPGDEDADDLDPRRETPRPGAEAEAASEAGRELAARKKGLEGRKQTIQESINALVRERSEVTRETERGRAERAELQREIETLRGERERIARGEQPRERAPQPEPGFDPKDPRPVERNFQDFAEYAEAVGRWGARQEVRAAERQRGQREEAVGRQRWEAERQQKYSTRYQAFAASNPTFEQEINREDLLLSAPMVDVIKDSDVGPQILLYLARNSREIDRLAAMHPVLAFGEMKKIEARLEGANSGSPQPVAQHSKAPAPIKPVGNASSRRSDTDEIPGDDVSDDEHFERMNRRDAMLRKRGLDPRKGYGVRL